MNMSFFDFDLSPTGRDPEAIVSVSPVPSDSLPLALNTCSISQPLFSSTKVHKHNSPSALKTLHDSYNPHPQSRDDDDDVVDIQLLS
jgi:hypothetical protein